MIAKTAIKSQKNILKEERVRSNGMSNELNRLSMHFKIVQLPGGAVVLLSCFTSLNTSFYFIYQTLKAALSRQFRLYL